MPKSPYIPPYIADLASSAKTGEGYVGNQDRKHLITRNGIWHYYRRVPKRFQQVDLRTFHEETTETREHDVALSMRPGMKAAVEDLWSSLLKGDSNNAHEKYEAAVERARLEGFPYKTAEQIAAGTLANLVERLERLQAIGAGDANVAAALLGGRDLPRLTLSQALEKYKDLTRDRQRRYSPDQLRKFLAKRGNAISNMIKALDEDKIITELNRDDGLAFRSWLIARIEAGEIKSNAANKNISHAAQVLGTVSVKMELGLPNLFHKLHLEENDNGTRPAFETKWIVEKILADGALDGMEEQARAIVLAIIETGLRPVEFCNMFPQDIFISHNIPHVYVRDIDEDNVRRPRRMKTVHSERKIPLIGVSLEAMREYPGGFTRYLDRPTVLSDHVSNYFHKNGLLPTPRHSLYSLRHSFQERINSARTIERMDCELMGHKFTREKYGGISLEDKRDHLLKIAVSV